MFCNGWIGINCILCHMNAHSQPFQGDSEMLQCQISWLKIESFQKLPRNRIFSVCETPIEVLSRIITFSDCYGECRETVWNCGAQTLAQGTKAGHFRDGQNSNSFDFLTVIHCIIYLDVYINHEKRLLEGCLIRTGWRRHPVWEVLDWG